jgi:hypothetical protein
MRWRREAWPERIGRDNQGRYWMPPAFSRGLWSDAPSSRQIIVQPPAIFKGLRLTRSALVSHAEHFDRRNTRTVKPRARCLFLANPDRRACPFAPLFGGQADINSASSDRLGLLGIPVHPASLIRLAGATFLMLGVVLTRT